MSPHDELDQLLEQYAALEQQPLSPQLQHLQAALPTPVQNEVETLAVADAGPPAPDADAPAIPGLEILRELGRGGMGVVYLARQVELGRLVALKMIRKGSGAGPDDRLRFRAEAELAAQLQHPHLVPIHQIGAHEEQPFLLLEYVAGGSLAALTAAQPLPAMRAAALVCTLAEAMHYAHEQGVMHRDLKPANVLLTADGQPKISDFGLAKRIDVEQGQTHTGAVLGTPSYMAPEQATGRDKITPAADGYALGAILYELLVGRPPFKADTALDTLRLVLDADPVPPRRLQPKVPRDLETICLKCLEKAPTRRYATAAALADDLQRFLDGRPVLARPLSWLGRAARWTRRQPAWAALILFLLLVVIGSAVSGWIFAAELSATVDAKEKARQRADDNYQLMLKERNDKEDARQKAENARTAALKEKARAEEALTKAVLGADNWMLVADELRNHPGLLQVRRHMLEEGVKYYQDLLKLRPEDADLERQLGYTYNRLGTLHTRHGDPKIALDCLNKAQVLLTKETQLDTDAGKEHLAMLHNNLGSLHWREFVYNGANQQAHALADANLKKALHCWTELRDKHPASMLYQIGVCDILNNQVALLHAVGKFDEALPVAEQALGSATKALLSEPANTKAAMAVGHAHAQVGATLAEKKQFVQAIPHLQKASALRREIARRFPSADNRRSHALSLLHLGGYSCQQGIAAKDGLLLGKAKAFLLESKAEYESLIKSEGKSAQYLHGVQNCVDRLAEVEPWLHKLRPHDGALILPQETAPAKA